MIAQSTTKPGPVKPKKNSQGGSFKTIHGDRKSDGGGSPETAASAKRAVKGMKNGPGKANGPGPHSYEGKHPGKRSGFKTVAPKTEGDSGLSTVDAWCQGKRGSYK